MKTISVFLMFVLLGICANAQDAKVLAEIAASSEGTVKNAPFSADAVSESIQTLADGNRIVRSSTSKLYRNSEGRFRREMTSGSGGMLGSLYSYGQGVTLLDPVGGFRATLQAVAGKNGGVLPVNPGINSVELFDDGEHEDVLLSRTASSTTR